LSRGANIEAVAFHEADNNGPNDQCAPADSSRYDIETRETTNFDMAPPVVCPEEQMLTSA